ncbi:MAG: DUF1015 domain-containing protein [Actinobacteria bacterium]|nr:DUF1015 domain-containing protein [Actinomycetota bacterium]
MADIRAFRGTFYNPQVVQDLSRTVAPPYDVIDEKQRNSLLARSPYNIVRLILPQKESRRAFWNSSAALYRAWKMGEVLTADSGRCIYIYRQTFDLPDGRTMSRTGVLALLRCRDFASGEVLPHEKTFPRTRVERLNLLRSCRANFSQIFTVFRDESEEVGGFIEEASSTDASMAFRDEEGIRHDVWRMEEGEQTRRLADILGDKKLIIADGHHRYETALAYSKEDAGAAGIDRPSAYASVALFRSEDPGLTILPVHRLLRRVKMPLHEIRRRLERYFDIETIQRDITERRGVFAQRLESAGRTAFIMITREGADLLVLRDGVDLGSILDGPESARWKVLDVSVLHALVIGEGMEVDAGEAAENGDLTFTPWESTVMSALQEGTAEAAFLVRSTSMDEIWEIAEGGERMPHKSSYFYPKLPSGLIIYDHGNALS